MLLGKRAAQLSWLRKAALLAGLLLLIALIVAIFQRGRDLASLAALGYPGVAILMFFGSSTVLLPAPGFAAVLAAGTVWNPVLVGLSAGFGSAAGELSGYLLGMGGGAVLSLKENERWKQAHCWLARRGFLAILLLAAIPNPLFDVLGLVAGSLAYSMRRFWLACLLGNCFKYTCMALLADSAMAYWFSL